METLFLFPLDIRAVISKITIDFQLMDGTVKNLETVIESRQKAEVKYEDAVASGKTAVISSFTKT